jgi:hypothetical protein
LLRVILLTLLLVLALLATAELFRRRPFTLRVIPALLGVAVLLAVVGPWNVLAASRRSQQQRLADALRAARVDLTRPLAGDTTPRPVSRELYDRITNIGFYLQNNFGDSAIAEVTRGAVPVIQWRSIAEAFRLVVAYNDTLPSVTHGTLHPNQPVRIPDGVIYRVVAPGPQVRANGSTLTITVSGETLVAELDTMIERLPPVRRREQRALPNYSAPVFDQQRNLRGQLILLDAMIQRWPDSVQIVNVNGVLILRNR